MHREADLTTKMAAAFCRVFVGPATLEPGSLDGKSGLTPAQLEGLRFVLTHPRCRVKDVARGLRVSHPAATKLVDRLVAKGTLARETNTEDRREVNLSLTAAGGEALASSRRSQSRSLAATLARMTARDRRSLEIGLRAYLGAALRTPGEVEAVCGRCGTEHVPECPLGVIYERLTGRPSPPA